MAYGTYPYGTAPLGSGEGGDIDRNIVNVPTAFISVSTEEPIVAVRYQYTTRRHNALERRSPCPT